VKPQRRILMVCPQFRPLVGGYERAAERLSHGLIAEGHHVEVVTERRDPGWPKEEEDGGLRVRRLWCLYRPGLHTLTAVLALGLYLLLHARRFDVLHVHQYGWSAAMTSAIGALLARPVVLKLTNTGYMGISASLPGGPAGAISRALHRRISACIVTSERAAQEARKFGIPAERIHRVPNPLETQHFRPASDSEKAARRAEVGIGQGFLAVSAGRLSGEKNYSMLIEAWSRFAKQHEDVTLAILGDGPLHSELLQQIDASGVSDRLLLPGRIEDPLVWYQAADAYLLSSDIEGLSNSLMEAMGSGLAIVSTAVSGSEDVFAEAAVGELVPTGDPAAMAAAIEKLHADAKRRVGWGHAARQYAVDHYSLAAVVAAIEACYAAVSADKISRY
jgi:glycosyltransferase involved in cell wall biosynthesis